MNHLSLPRRSLAAIGVLTFAGCQTALNQPASPSEHFLGRLSSGCAPNDTPSIIFELRSATGTGQVYLHLWPSPALAVSGQARLDVAEGEAIAAYCSEPDACQPARWVDVRIDRPPAEGTIRGEWRLGMPDGSELKGTFEADWLALQAICG